MNSTELIRYLVDLLLEEKTKNNQETDKKTTESDKETDSQNVRG